MLRPPLGNMLKPPLRYMFVRTKATLNRTYKNRHAERPPYRPVDPLVDNPTATVSTLEADLTFIHRPPPTAPSPFSLSTAPSSPLLLRPSSLEPNITQLPPLLRPSAAKLETPRVSDEVIEEIRKLRHAKPRKYTRSVLAKQFNCSKNFVALVAALKRPQSKVLNKEQDARHENVRQRWGQRKSLAREIRKKRRDFW